MAETLAKIKEQNRLRQQRFYQKNKDKINEQRRANTKIIKDFKEGKTPDIVIPQLPQPVPIVEPAKIVLPQILNLEEVIKLLDQLKANDVIKTDGSLKTYKDGIKRLMKLTNCINLITCLQNPQEIKEAIDNSTFALNTKKGLYQAVVFIIDNLKLPYPKEVFDEYKKLFGVNKLKSHAQTKEKTKEKVDKFSTYFEKVKEHFGENSKMGLLIGLYDAFTGRDVFQLKITNDKDEINNSKINYLLLTNKQFTLIINNYKTSKKYGTYTVKLTKHLTKLIKHYIISNELKFGDYLFGDKPLSSFISKNNKAIGINGGIDLIRHMRITEEFQKATDEGRVLTEEERIDLANKLQHSPSAQLLYLRNQ